MDGVLKWPWTQSLATAREGDFLKIEEVLFGTLREHLWEVGVRVGERLEYVRMDEEGLEVRLPDGKGVKVAREHAWFIIVEREAHRKPEQD